MPFEHNDSSEYAGLLLFFIKRLRLTLSDFVILHFINRSVAGIGRWKFHSAHTHYGRQVTHAAEVNLNTQGTLGRVGVTVWSLH